MLSSFSLFSSSCTYLCICYLSKKIDSLNTRTNTPKHEISLCILTYIFSNSVVLLLMVAIYYNVYASFNLTFPTFLLKVHFRMCLFIALSCNTQHSLHFLYFLLTYADYSVIHMHIFLLSL